VDPYDQTKLDVSGSCVACSIAYALNVYHNQTDLGQGVSLEQVLDLAINNDLLSSRGNGTHSKGTVGIGYLFGEVDWGFYGSEKPDYPTEKDGEQYKRVYYKNGIQSTEDPFEHGYDLMRHYLKLGYPIVVGVKMNMRTKPSDIGHAVVITGIDEKNRLRIGDSFSRIATRQGARKPFPFGKPIWTVKPGSYVVEWEEFDASWNNCDDYEGIEVTGDPVFNNFNPKEEGYRFWMVIKPQK